MTPEEQEQADVVQWFRKRWPEHAKSLRVSQSGGFIGRGKQGAIRRAKIKALGGVTGEADLAILISKGGYGCFLAEHKEAQGKHEATPEQIDYVDYHNAIGNLAVITRGVEGLKSAIAAYMEM